ncbi:sensor domain-containing diguanylate cyclase [Amorphus orientalis]|uniref:diguanylate cyclase n=1 Tax=Amorphus orientalis TaxID=649198 RepID=A0AAE3VP30_9HYPH|nr:sensor domain-containing diguanylate cyclase [Amorphus orientalis]MDQ0315201.1 diguanylate cyclase (GGDEF)-like protein [Amorphus orientalis]
MVNPLNVTIAGGSSGVENDRGNGANPARERTSAIAGLGITDLETLDIFDQVSRIAASALEVPLAFVSLLDGERQWIKTTRCRQMDAAPLTDSFCIHAVDGEDVFVVEDARDDPRFATNRFVVEAPHIRFYAGAPLYAGASIPIGALGVADTSPRQLGPAKREVLSGLAALASRQLDLQREAMMDGLTGAWNRRMLAQVVSAEIRRGNRIGRKFALAMLDLDHFKRLNDEFGHAAGDEVLIEFARLARDNLRPEDWFFRMGGEEFAALIVDSSSTKAEGLIEQLRADLEARGPKLGGRGVTFSSGITDHRPRVLGGSDDDSLPRILARADEALYRAKAGGRNCSVCAGQERIDA